MATYYARKTGNINASDVWATTPTGTAGAVTFADGDVLVSNSFTITINVNTNLGSTGQIRNDNVGGATAGGNFTLNSGINLTANCIAGSANLINWTGTAGVTTTITGNLTATGNGIVVNTSSFGTIGTLTVIGSLNPAGVGFTTGHAIYAYGGSIYNIIGDLNFGVGGYAIYLVNNSATFNITGNVYGVIFNFLSPCTMNITGNVFGTPSGTNITLPCSQNHIITVVGTVTGGANAVGASNTSTGGTLIVTRAKGNGFGNGSSGLTAQVGVAANQTGTTRVYEIEYGDLGQSPTSGPVSFVNSTSNVALFYRPSLTKKTLVDAAASLDLPAANNVRSGTIYNFGNSTGTCAIPSASSVYYGVSVDNTTGTATLAPQSIWDSQTSSMTTSGSIGERLKNAATVSSVGTQITNIAG